ncbi:MAG TPA: L,D-transpeptidase family protein [Acidimicrobiales bacterium]|nr:L,D-transpeptidase family protein [Acidimicrobiales bacterium]
MALLRPHAHRSTGAVEAPVVVCALVCALAGTLLAGCGTASRPVGLTPTTVPQPGAPRGSTSTSPAPTSTTSTPSTTAPASTTTTTAPAMLRPGARGPAVLALQQRLRALGYWLGTPNGVFGDSTEQAVYALQKVAGIGRDGVVGPQTAAALSAGDRPQPRSRSGYVIEVDLGDDLVMFVSDGALQYVLNTSTGGGYTYVEHGVAARAITPTGRFTVYRQVDGLVVDSLGELWRPKFFYEGFALHGDSYVPPTPVSHGCVRVSNEAIDWIWSDNLAPIGTTLWVYR